MSLTQINKAGLDEIALDHVFTIGASGSSAYTFQGEGLNGTVNNPTLYLTRGKTYRFENGSGGHPIRIQSTSGASGTAYNTGVTNNAGSGTVIVEVQHDAPDVLYYQCTSHAAMNGILYITGALADGGVTTAKIADNAVTTNKIGSEQVVASNIAGGTITAGKLASNSVTTTKIADSQITTAKINAGAVTTAKIADSQITTAKINDDAVTSAKLGAGSVDNTALANNSINGNKLQDNCVATSEIQDNAVTTAKIADDAITTDKIGNNAVSSGQINDNAVGSNQITSDAVVTSKIAAGSITTNRIADQAVTLDKLPHGTSSNNGKFLRANNGADPTFESLPASGLSNIVEDTSPQLGGDLLQNGNSIVGYNNEKHKFGNSGNMEVYHTGSVGVVKNTDSSNLYLQANNVAILNSPANSTRAWFGANNAVQLYYNNSEKFATKDYGVHFTGYKSQSSYVGFHVKGSNDNQGYGTSHGSSLTTYDVDYYSPIPMFSSRTVDYGSSYLSFPSYAGGNYIKFTAPVSGLYFLQLIASIETHSGGDWAGISWEVNTTTANGSSGFMNNERGIMVAYERVNTDTGMGTNLSTVLHLSANDYVVLYQQSSAVIRWKSNQYYARGHLIS